MFICLVYMPFTKVSSAHCRLLGSLCFIRNYLAITASDIKNNSRLFSGIICRYLLEQLAPFGSLQGSEQPGTPSGVIDQMVADCLRSDQAAAVIEDQRDIDYCV